MRCDAAAAAHLDQQRHGLHMPLGARVVQCRPATPARPRPRPHSAAAAAAAATCVEQQRTDRPRRARAVCDAEAPAAAAPASGMVHGRAGTSDASAGGRSREGDPELPMGKEGEHGSSTRCLPLTLWSPSIAAMCNVVGGAAATGCDCASRHGQRAVAAAAAAPPPPRPRRPPPPCSSDGQVAVALPPMSPARSPSCASV
jgi:hypothetical protein